MAVFDQNSQVSPTFPFLLSMDKFLILTNIFKYGQISHFCNLSTNVSFWPPFLFFSQNFDVWPNFPFLMNIYIFDQKSDVWPNVPSSMQILVFDQHSNVGQFLAKLVIFDQNFENWPKFVKFSKKNVATFSVLILLLTYNKPYNYMFWWRSTSCLYICVFGRAYFIWALLPDAL